MSEDGLVLRLLTRLFHYRLAVTGVAGLLLLSGSALFDGLQPGVSSAQITVVVLLCSVLVSTVWLREDPYSGDGVFVTYPQLWPYFYPAVGAVLTLWAAVVPDDEVGRVSALGVTVGGRALLLLTGVGFLVAPLWGLRTTDTTPEE
ncbi:MAG: hypothetical protein J07HB67_02149 [halophilic archaeon J07HB67]|jgi:hypothetical protein|nr:MAG: hypothetical protein J07HB67_02149 [halophilic archaeon J07HB67]